MKQFIAPTYTFSPGASGVGFVNLSGISGFNPKFLVSIINQTAGQIIYSTASTTLGYTSVVGTTVTLQFNTTGMLPTDELQVIYEVQGDLPVSVGNFPTSQDVNLHDGAGNAIGSTAGALDINIASGTVSNPSVSATGAVAPAQATFVGGSDGTNLIGLKVNATGALEVVASPNLKGEFVRNDYTVNSVNTTTYYELIASTSLAYSVVEIFDSSGETLKLALGAASSEIDQFIIFPGGNGRIPFNIPSGSRVSIKALSATASAGEIDINFYV